MYIKYEVPVKRRNFFDGKKILYGKVIQKNILKTSGIELLKVKYINYYNMIDVIDTEEANKLNLLDKIKLLFIRR